MASKSLEIIFKAKDETSASLKKMGLTADQTARKMREINNSKNSQKPSESFADRIDSKAKHIEESFLGEDRGINKVLKGGLVGLVGEQLASASDKMLELQKQFREGKIGAGQMVEEVGKGIPIFGGFFTAALNVREMFTHENEEAEKLNQKFKLRNDLDEAQLKSLQEQKQHLKAIADIVDKINQRRGRVGLEGYALGQYDQQNAANDRLKALQDKRDADLQKVRNDALSQLKNVNDRKLDGTITNEDAEAAKRQIKDEAAKLAQTYNTAYNDAVAKERNTSGAELFEWQKQQTEQSEKLVSQHEQEITSIVAKARQERLKALGLSGNAELEAIAANAEAQKQAVRRQYDEERKTIAPALEKQLEAQKDRRLKAIDDEAASARQAYQYQTRQTVDQQLRQRKQSDLDFAASAAGTPAEQLRAKREAERYRHLLQCGDAAVVRHLCRRYRYEQLRGRLLRQLGGQPDLSAGIQRGWRRDVDG